MIFSELFLFSKFAKLAILIAATIFCEVLRFSSFITYTSSL